MRTCKIAPGVCIITFLVFCTGLCFGENLNNYKSWLTNEFESQVANGASHEYAEGYVSGCSSRKYKDGNDTYSHMQDKLRLKKDAQYAKGWNAGFKACGLDGNKRWFRKLRKASDKYNPKDQSRRKMWDELRK